MPSSLTSRQEIHDRHGHLSNNFKRDAVTQITERGVPTEQVSKRLGVTTHSLCVKAQVRDGSVGQDGKGCQDPPAKARTGPSVAGKVLMHLDQARQLTSMGWAALPHAPIILSIR